MLYSSGGHQRTVWGLEVPRLLVQVVGNKNSDGSVIHGRLDSLSRDIFPKWNDWLIELNFYTESKAPLFLNISISQQPLVDRLL